MRTTNTGGEGTPETTTQEIVWAVATQVDDLSGEHLPPLMEAILGAGAKDVTASPVLMKKGRSGFRVEALCGADTRQAVERAMLVHSSSFGVRSWPTERRILDRRFETVQTDYGDIRIKLGYLDGELVHSAPEYEDVAAAARTNGVPVPQVHRAAWLGWAQGRTT